MRPKRRDKESKSSGNIAGLPMCKTNTRGAEAAAQGKGPVSQSCIPGPPAKSPLMPCTFPRKCPRPPRQLFKGYAFTLLREDTSHLWSSNNDADLGQSPWAPIVVTDIKCRVWHVAAAQG